MGAYLAAPCRSTAARDRMLAFLGQHLSPLPDIHVGPPQLGNKVCAYAKRPLDIGYYTSGMGLEDRELADNLLRWVALRVGRTRVFAREWIPGHERVTLHYTLYEHEPVPLVVKSQYSDVPDPWELGERYTLCDEFGWSRSMRGPDPGQDPAEDATTPPHLLEIRTRKAKAGQAVRAELQRLDALWGPRT